MANIPSATKPSRVLAIFLDGYDAQLGQRFMADGDMPELARLTTDCARFQLDHGAAQRTGLASEHVATGLSPDAAKRWAAVHFDPASYGVWQEGTRLRPFAAELPLRSVVFDAPYFDLRRAANLTGVVGWGAHDPGVVALSRPLGLGAELHRRFGAYPAERFIYGLTWPCAQQTSVMGAALAHAVDVRREAALWLLRERLPEWQLALVAVSEPHSVIEALWHGVDRAHPLHGLPSAAPAERGVRAVYRAVDRLLGELARTCSDADLVVFSMAGMGANHSDVASMVLLPELLHRWHYGAPHLAARSAWGRNAEEQGRAILSVENWEQLVGSGFPSTRAATLGRKLLRKAPRRLKAAVAHMVELVKHASTRSPGPGGAARTGLLRWMPATAYQRFWAEMRAFAMPSFYDGRIRVNLRGRERDGRVDSADLPRVVAELEQHLRACVDPATGDSVVDSFEYPATRDPLRRTPTECDLIVVWKGAALALAHPRFGMIGPVPYRRTGGHTNPVGMALVRSARAPAGDYGERSAFDVVPTLIDLLGQPERATLSGRSLLSEVGAGRLP